MVFPTRIEEAPIEELSLQDTLLPLTSGPATRNQPHSPISCSLPQRRILCATELPVPGITEQVSATHQRCITCNVIVCTWY